MKQRGGEEDEEEGEEGEEEEVAKGGAKADNQMSRLSLSVA